jgi:hypothetical protein
MATLTAAAQKAISKPPAQPLSIAKPASTDNDDVDGFEFVCRDLSPAAREAVSVMVGAEPSTDEIADVGMARYCMVEAVDGEWPTLRMFKTAEALAKRIGAMEGEDAVLWVYFGLPLQFTRGPQRYLLLPDGVTAIQVPMYAGGPCRKVSSDLLSNLETQDDGFVGPPELTVVLEAPGKPIKKDAPSAKIYEEDDDDDDDDEEDDD